MRGRRRRSRKGCRVLMGKRVLRIRRGWSLQAVVLVLRWRTGLLWRRRRWRLLAVSSLAAVDFPAGPRPSLRGAQEVIDAPLLVGPVPGGRAARSEGGCRLPHWVTVHAPSPSSSSSSCSRVGGPSRGSERPDSLHLHCYPLSPSRSGGGGVDDLAMVRPLILILQLLQLLPLLLWLRLRVGSSHPPGFLQSINARLKVVVGLKTDRHGAFGILPAGPRDEGSVMIAGRANTECNVQFNEILMLCVCGRHDSAERLTILGSNVALMSCDCGRHQISPLDPE